jgi:ribosomal protein S18 acetylase RimI-like enzyme
MGTEPGVRALRALAPADLPQVARVHRIAFPGSLLTLLGKEVAERYYLWQLVDGPHEVTAVGVFDVDRLVGFLIGGTFRGSLSGFVHANRSFLVRRVAARPWLAMSPEVQRRLRSAWPWAGQRRSPVGAATRTAAHFGILAIAVEPQAQGTGVGRTLLEAAEREAVDAGFTAMSLTVRNSNLRAMAFYERMGWQKQPLANEHSEHMTKQLPPSP